MNKTLIVVGFFILIGLGIVGAVVLLIFRPEHLASFIAAITTLLGIGSTAVIMIYGLGKQGQQLDTIKANTNGTLSKLQDENTKLTRIIVERGLDPTEASGQHRADES